MAFNVLVVDDSAVMRSMIIRTIQMTGVPLGTVHQAANGQEGLDVVRSEWVDLALVDINMPVMNGEEMINRVREDPLTRDVAIIVVSTEGSTTRIQRFRDQGAAFVHKPFTAEELRETILRVTGVSHEQSVPIGTSEGSELDF